MDAKQIVTDDDGKRRNGFVIANPAMIKWRDKCILVMVGLPARGKSYIAHKSLFYLQWMGYNAKMFNVGSMRRTASTDNNANFFDASNKDARNIRENVAFECLEQLLNWLEEGGQIAFFDATNTTQERRLRVVEQCKKKHPAINVVFVEIMCNDPKTLRENYIQKATNSPDYRGIPLEQALIDLEKRVTNYQKVYEPLGQGQLESHTSISYIKLCDLQSRVICNRIRGEQATSIMKFMMGLHVEKRPIYLFRAAECTKSDEEVKRGEAVATFVNRLTKGVKLPFDIHIPTIGSKTAPLTTAGTAFSENVARFLCTRHPDNLDNINVYTSTHTRAVDTVTPFIKATSHGPDLHYYSSLNILDRGKLGVERVENLQGILSTEFPKWMADPFRYRFPGGESPKDVVEKLEPLVLELERNTNPCVVVSHSGTLELLYGYFIGCTQNDFLTLDVPLHTVIELIPSTYGWVEKRFFFDANGLTHESVVDKHHVGHASYTISKVQAEGKLVEAQQNMTISTTSKL